MTPFPIAFQARIWPLQLNIISQYSWIQKKKKKKSVNLPTKKLKGDNHGWPPRWRLIHSIRVVNHIGWLSLS